MHSYNGLHKILIALSIIAIIFITYTTILIDNFKTPETTVTFFHNSNAYYYIAEIIKTDIRGRYPLKLQTNIVELTIADTLLNTVISPNVIERLSLPVLKIRQKVAGLPLSFAENNLVINTKQYTDNFNQTIGSLNLPSGIIDAGKNLVAAVPPQITIVDTQKNPNSILVGITKTKIFFEHVQTALTIAWVILIASAIGFLVINVAFLKRLMHGLLWIFSICGILLLIFSYLLPWLLSVFSSNPDPLTGALKDALVNSMVVYYFSLTRNISLVYICIALIAFLVYHFVPFPKVQVWTDIHILRKSPERLSASTKRKRKK